MATALAWRDGQETTTTSSAAQVHQFALPAPGDSSLRIRPPSPGPRPQTAPPGNLSITPPSSGDQASPPGANAGTPVQTQDLSHLGLRPHPQRPPRNPLSGSTNTVPRPSMSPQEQQRKRLKESTPTTLPPGNWSEEFGVYDPHSRNMETDETSEDESRQAPTTDNEAPFNAFGAADPRNVPDTTGPRNVPDTAAVSLTSEQTEIRAWFRAHQDRVCQLDDGFIRWLAPVYWIKIGSLHQKWDLWECLPTAIRTMPNMGQWTLEKKFFMFCHCLIFGRLHKSRSLNHQHLGEHFLAIQLLNMLLLFMLLQLEAWRAFFNSGKISPSILHDPDSMSFFALGARRTGDPKWDSQELTRILHNGWHASKNACNVLLVAVGWGTGENIDVGGEHPCIQKTKDGGIVHHRRAKLWVCHTDSHLIHGIAFCSTATDPEAPF